MASRTESNSQAPVQNFEILYNQTAEKIDGKGGGKTTRVKLIGLTVDSSTHYMKALVIDQNENFFSRMAKSIHVFVHSARYVRIGEQEGKTVYARVSSAALRFGLGEGQIKAKENDIINTLVQQGNQQLQGKRQAEVEAQLPQSQAMKSETRLEKVAKPFATDIPTAVSSEPLPETNSKPVEKQEKAFRDFRSTSWSNPEEEMAEQVDIASLKMKAEEISTLSFGKGLNQFRTAQKQAIKDRLMELKNDPEYQIDDAHFEKFYDGYAEIFSAHAVANPDSKLDTTTLSKILIKGFKTLQANEQQVAEKGGVINVDGKYYIVKLAEKKLHIIDPKGQLIGEGGNNTAIKANNIALGQMQALRHLKLPKTNPQDISSKPAEHLIGSVAREQEKISKLKEKGVEGLVDKSHYVEVFIPNHGWIVGSFGTIYNEDVLKLAHKNPDYDSELEMDCCVQMAKSVVNAEKAGVTHNDIKPGNFLVKTKKNEDGSIAKVDVRLADFELASETGVDFFVEEYLGTPGYGSYLDAIYMKGFAEKATKASTEIQEAGKVYAAQVNGSPEQAAARKIWEAKYQEFIKAMDLLNEARKNRDTYSLGKSILEVLSANIPPIVYSWKTKDLLKKLDEWAKINPGSEKLVQVLKNSVEDEPDDRPSKEEILIALESYKNIQSS